MNDARNLENNHTSGLFMNNSGTSLNQFEVDSEDDIFFWLSRTMGMLRVLTEKERVSF